jgi:coenzyme F420-reducing hydrogenase gamma subunit
MKKNKKPSIAIFGLTSCEGCQFAILDLHDKFLELTKYIELDEFRLLEDERERSHYDIAFIEGNPVTKENLDILKHIRKIAKIVVVLGNCADLGGVWEIKNYHDIKKTGCYVYKQCQTIENRAVIEVPKAIKVDYVLPGCPINAQNFLALVYSLLNGTPWKLKQNPVCWECQINKNPCLLQQGKICLGPLALGGCNAVCLNSRQECWACRGILDQAEEKIVNLIKILVSHGWTKTDILEKMEFFGARDRIEAALDSALIIKK